MTQNANSLYSTLQKYVDVLIKEADLIPEERKSVLAKLASYIDSKRGADKPVSLNFICTHNSRRSHISQLWAAVAAWYFGMDQFFTFSGGTEATAFNPRAVAAIERAGFAIQNPGGDNPRYQVTFAEEGPGQTCFSKTFDDPFNPKQEFAAIMTCSDADENCPFVPGAEFRLSLTYLDPKEADDTPEESERYDERVRQIGREIFYAFSIITKS